MNRLTDAELTEARLNLAKARASLECEGPVLTDDEEALFRQFEVERLPTRKAAGALSSSAGGSASGRYMRPSDGRRSIPLSRYKRPHQQRRYPGCRRSRAIRAAGDGAATP